MRVLKPMAALFCVGLLSAAFSLPVMADEWNQPSSQPSENPAVTAQDADTSNVAADNEQSTTPQQPTDTQEKATSQQAGSEAKETQELPKTASPLPLLTLAGFIAVGSGLGLRRLSKKLA